MKTYEEEFISLLRSYQGIIHKVNLIYFPVSEDRKDNFQEVVYQMWRAYPKLKNKEKNSLMDIRDCNKYCRFQNTKRLTLYILGGYRIY